ncbi:MAG: hypothetical protein HY646_15235, partial [Acidobacteria bacterium]|nr:hypothetical protein [Acidobacteriota bacterium]
MFGIVFVLLLQASPEAVIRGDAYQMLVPHGWSATESRPDRLVHTTGASFEVLSIPRAAADIQQYAIRGVEQVWRPLGFVVVGKPVERKVRGYPAIQYDIQGNRLSERRKLRYIAVDRGAGSYELIYENSDEGFDLLLNEAERIAASARPIDEANEEQALHTVR